MTYVPESDSQPNERANGQTAAIILAAGSSTRMAGIDKIWEALDGVPVLAHSLSVFASLPEITDVVLVAPRDQHARIRALAGEIAPRAHVVEGGSRRQDSVASALAAVPDAAWYLVHDGARPLVTAELVRRVLAAARDHGAAIPGVAVHDAIKRVDEHGRVVASVERDALRAVQTPQGFAGPLLRRAHAEVSDTVADDAAMVEALGLPVQVVEGDPENRKITTRVDLAIARALIQGRRQERAD